MNHYQMNLYPRQIQAFKLLQDDSTREVLYGGAAGGAKTWLGCAWQVFNRLSFAGTRGLIARARLKNLRHTTLKTFFSVTQTLGLKQDVHYSYDVQEGLIKFYNGSEIVLRHLQDMPSDPDFASLGGLEITDAFIDEASEVSEKAVHIVASRIRYRLDVAGLLPKLLLCSNPSRNWLYYNFYEPSVKGNLPSYRKFVQAFVDDNKTVGFAETYSNQLLNLDRVSRERLLLGMWDYADDVLNLFRLESLQNMILPSKPNLKEKFYISADIARFGADATVIGLWKGMTLEDVWVLQKASLKESAGLIAAIMNKRSIEPHRVIVDTDGIGAGVVDQLPNGVVQFMAQSRPIKVGQSAASFATLKAQCYFMVSQAVEDGILRVNPILAAKYHDGKPIIQRLQEELLSVRRSSELVENKLNINPKHEQKLLLGRSPDFADMVMMRQYFELKPSVFAFS